MKLQLRTVILGLTIGLPSATLFAADSGQIDPGQLPFVVQQVIAAKYPGWTVANATKLEANGRTEYVVSLTDQTIEIQSVLDEGGHILEAARGTARAAAAESTATATATATGQDDNDGPKQKGKKAGKKFGKPKLYGFAQAFYREAFDTGIDNVVDNSNFRVQRVRLGVKGDINSWASYEIEIDPRAPEVTGILRDAYLRLNVIPNHEIRIGQQKTQFGYENRESSTHLFAVNRAEMSDSISRGLNLRDIGVGLLGHVNVSDSWRIEDAITVVNGAGINVQNDDTSRKNVWGRIGVRHKSGDDWERFGISGGAGDYIDPNDPLDPEDDILVKFDSIGIDVEVEREWFFLSAEYAFGNNQQTNATPPADPGDLLDEESKPDGYYVSLVGKTHWKVGPILRYDVFNDTFARWTFGAYYGNPKDQFRVMVNYEYRKTFEDAEGNIGRGDDKAYLWAQYRF